MDESLGGLNDHMQKNFILEHTLNDDRLPNLLQLCLKHESIQLMLDPETKLKPYDMWKNTVKQESPNAVDQINTMEQK